MALLEIVIITIQTIIFSGLGLILALPVWGTLVRIRANYTPKGVQLNSEGDTQSHASSAVTGFFAMIARVKGLEGWAGFYRGLMPTLIFDVCFALLEGIFYGTLAGRIWIAFGAPGFGYRAIILLYASIPLYIIKARAVATPHRLSYFALDRSLHVLLTPAERSRPWMLYLTPGLLAATTSNIVYTFAMHALRRALFPGISSPDKNHWAFQVVWTTWPRLGLFYGIIVVGSLVLGPLDVATVRLSVQRNHSEIEGGDAEQTALFAGADEDVIELRSDANPYIGLADCARKIAREEGWTALYRGWWLTLAFGLFGALTY